MADKEVADSPIVEAGIAGDGSTTPPWPNATPPLVALSSPPPNPHHPLACQLHKPAPSSPEKT